MKCTNCGSVYTSDTVKFCPYCGTKVQLLAEPPAASTSGSAQQAAPKHYAQAPAIEERRPEPARQPEPARTHVVIDGASPEMWDSTYHTFAQAQMAAAHVSKAEDLCAAARADLQEAKGLLNRMTGWGIAVALLVAMFFANYGGSTGPAAGLLLAPIVFAVGPGMVGIRQWARRNGWFIIFNWVFIIAMLGILLTIALFAGWFFYAGQFGKVQKAKHEVEEADRLLDRMTAEVY